MMRHFEKKGKMPLFRRIGVEGASVRLSVGQAASGQVDTRLRCRSKDEAARTAEKWIRWALDAGFAEVELPDGTPGVIMHVGPGGALRVRIDPYADVYVPPDAIRSRKVAIGRRVVLAGIGAQRGPGADFMFGSKLRATALTDFPGPRTWRSGARPGPLDHKAVRALQEAFGEWVAGKREFQRSIGALPAGTLILAWEKGVHRLLHRTAARVQYENVLNSKWQRQTSPVLECHPKFCAAVPAEVLRELARAYGEGSLT